MPVIKSAKKKLRKDRKREVINKNLKNLFKKNIKLAEKNPSEANVRKAVKIVDKIAKKNIIHKNKASRIKSKLSRLLAGKKPLTKVSQATKKSPKTKTSKTKAKK
jgi:small subunit ribosomal protein S20